MNANAVTTINGNTTVTANSISLKSNSTITALSIVGNTTVTNTSITGNTFTVTGNTQFANTINVVSNATVNGALTVNNTAATGNTTVTGFINVSSYGTFAGTVNASALNIGANISSSTTQLNIGNSFITDSVSTTFNANSGVANSTDTFTFVSNPFSNGDLVIYTTNTGNTSLIGLTTNSVYYVINTTSTTLRLSTTLGGSNVDVTAGLNETGHNLTRLSRIVTPLFVSQRTVFNDTINVSGSSNLANVNSGNTVITGFINVNSFGNFGGVVNSIGFNVGSNVSISNTFVSVGNSTVNSFVNSSSGNFVNLNISGNAVFSTTANIAGAVRAGNTTVNGNLTVNTYLIVGTVTNTANLNVTTSDNIANLTITASANIQSNVSIQNNYVIVVTSNTNVGANVTGAQTIFSFPKASYSSAKITAQVKTVDDSNTQIQEIVLAHDNSGNAFLTVYGTISAPLAANLGIFTTSINNANVELYFQQNTANSRIKVIAHLIV